MEKMFMYSLTKYFRFMDYQIYAFTHANFLDLAFRELKAKGLCMPLHSQAIRSLLLSPFSFNEFCNMFNKDPIKDNMTLL